jgi:SAM-dependent methyltransferase
MSSLYATPREVRSKDDCYFYHSMDLPGIGEVAGEWDIRGRESDYLGGVSFRGKRVLEMGTASGALCFHMEREGAEVVAYDLSPEQSWDIVPYWGMGKEKLESLIAERRAAIGKLNNGFWLAHKALGSRAKVVYGAVYDVPEAIGAVDIVTFTSILLHVRDPFLAMHRASRLARETIVVTEKIREKKLAFEAIERLGLPYARFLPDAKTQSPWETWWSLTPQIVRNFVRVLGFPNTKTRYFDTPSKWGTEKMFAVVATR